MIWTGGGVVKKVREANISFVATRTLKQSKLGPTFVRRKARYATRIIITFRLWLLLLLLAMIPRFCCSEFVTLSEHESVFFPSLFYPIYS